MDANVNVERTVSMAIKHFEHFEAISSAVPAQDGFEAVIGVKARERKEVSLIFIE